MSPLFFIRLSLNTTAPFASTAFAGDRSHDPLSDSRKASASYIGFWDFSLGRKVKQSRPFLIFENFFRTLVIFFIS